MPAPAAAPTGDERDLTGLVAALDRSLAVIEFGLDGTVITANQNFLDLMGYSLPAVKGKHHRMFCTPEHAESQEYADFWARLRAGTFVQDEFLRVTRDGREGRAGADVAGVGADVRRGARRRRALRCSGACRDGSAGCMGDGALRSVRLAGEACRRHEQPEELSHAYPYGARGQRFPFWCR